MSETFIFLFTCVYNDRKHINRLFDSIADQTATNFVYYLYDDASDKDCYDDLYNDLKEKLNKRGIKAYYEKGKKNLGINKATEHCLIKLRDEFKDCTHFVWVNSDDWLSVEYVKLMSTTIKHNSNYAVYIPNVFFCYENTGISIKGYSYSYVRKSKTYLVDLMNTGTLIFSHFVVDKNKFIKINPSCLIFDNSNFKNFFNDCCVLFLLSAFCLNFYFINKCVSYYLIRKSSESNRAVRTSTFSFLPYHYHYINEINSGYASTYQQIMFVVLTHYICSLYCEQHKYKLLKRQFHINKKIFVKYNLKKYYLYPKKSSYFLFYFPHFYNAIHAIVKKYGKK